MDTTESHAPEPVVRHAGICSTVLGAQFYQPQPMASDIGQPIKVCLIGAGPVNFGSSDGLVPGESLGGWNHASRLEQLPGGHQCALAGPAAATTGSEVR